MTANPPKPILVWLTPPGPNSWKVIFLLEELGLNYETKAIRHDDIKKKPYTDVNPNGRVPAIEDPNTGLTIWETGAILQYVIEQYDTDHHLSFDTLKERHQCNQWLHFQTSGQGPYFGQAGWFIHLHAEKLPSAIERYTAEIRRVLGVLEGELAARPVDAAWLVGGRMSFADLAFAPWNNRLAEVLVQPWDDVWAGLPHVRAWHERMVALPSWTRAMDVRARLMDAQGLQWNGIPKGIENYTDYKAKIDAGEDTRPE